MDEQRVIFPSIIKVNLACNSVVVQTNHQKKKKKLNAVEHKFDIDDMFMNRENHWGITPPDEFKVTIPENPLLSKQTVTSKKNLSN